MTPKKDYSIDERVTQLGEKTENLEERIAKIEGQIKIMLILETADMTITLFVLSLIIDILTHSVI